MARDKRVIAVVALSCLLSTALVDPVRGSGQQLLRSTVQRRLGNKRVAITIPTGWEVTYRDSASDWGTRQYVFSVESEVRIGKRSKAVSVDGAFLFSPVWRAKKFGELDGDPLRLAHGRQGVLNLHDYKLDYNPRRSEWRLTTVVNHNQVAVLLSFGCDAKDKRLAEPGIRKMLESLRFQ
jgi:hypothetical protein